MEVKIIEDSGKKAIIEISGETHTLPNVLKKELWNDKNVKISGYSIDHPLTGKPRIIVEVEKGSAKEAVIEAAKRIKADADKARKSFEKVAE